ncbi:AraC family transcriptional regulator [Paenibacillus sp. y28]|uniref:AraC family transcriptional regulator n=1 Tax=Paenibacillus sp. y28 TaxID=3129110 RepID=UPI0030194358
MLKALPGQFELKTAFAKIYCEPNWKWAKREKPLANFDLFYVWSGAGEVIVNDEPFQVGKGSCFLFRPGDMTSATHHPQKPLVLTYIHFDVDPPYHLIPDRYRVMKETTDFEALLTRYVRLFLVQTYGAEEEARLLLKQLMIHLLRDDQDKPELRSHTHNLQEVIHEVANYIKQHPGEINRVEELAARAHLSPRYFSLKFKELIGQSVQTYMIQAKIERAKHLLHYAGMSVTEVADALGYRDVFFFSRQFKQYTGVSPSEVR